jgi:hypothetical protein
MAQMQSITKIKSLKPLEASNKKEYFKTPFRGWGQNF